MKNKQIYLKDYKVSSYKIEKVSLNFELYDDWTIVTTQGVYYKNPESKESNFIELHGEELELLEIILNDRVLEKENYSFNLQGNLVIENLPENFILKVITKIYPLENTSLMGLYMSKGIFCTQCESEGFRRITYYPDRPDVMTLFTTRITADKQRYPVLLSNGNKVNEGLLDNERHFVEWHDPFPKPSYLFALVAGKLKHIEDSYTTLSGKEVVLRVFTEVHNISKCGYAMESLKRAMKWDEDRFGLEYDLDLFMIVAVDDFNSGAMENKGLNIFNSKLVFATPESATDNDYINIERVVAHEYFHNWTGDRVTCRDWFQLSLKEGLTVFRDSEFTADMHSRDAKRIWDVRFLRSHQFREDMSPMAHPIRPSFFEEISNFYTLTVYEKGAEVIRMYQTILGQEGFRKGMDLYFKRHDGQAVTTEDFLKAMADANNKDLSQFQTWYDQAGTPLVEITSHYDEENEKYTLHMKQSCPKTPENEIKKPFIIPIKFGLIGENGEEVKTKENLIILTQFEQSFVFDNIKGKVIPSLGRGFSAPVHIEYNYGREDYVFLMKHDSDSFNRFEASQNLLKKNILQMVLSGKKNDNKELIESFKYILLNDQLDNAFKAEVVTLPSETEVGDIIGKDVSPLQVHNAREALLKNIAKELKNILEDTYKKLNKTKEYRVESQDIGDRKLQNICLLYLGYVMGPELAYSQYKESNNMTNTLAAFSCLSNIDCKEREYAIKDFFQKWKNDNNVIDKWFTIQASSSLDNTLEKIKELSEHELFDITNPNKARALFNSFAVLNPFIFNREDGAGYEFIASRVLELDRLNPMIASRLAKSLINWKSLEKGLGEKLRNQLVRISENTNLSGDLAEVINKSLI